MNTLFPALACPLDLQPLQKTGSSCHCSQGHNFDLAKNGSINLLPVQLKKSKSPGDHAAMIQSRAVVLNSGLYNFVYATLKNTILAEFSERPSTRAQKLLVDAGCGEGYYTGRLQEDLASHNELSVLGFDISKDAVRAACKRSSQVNWVVATNKRIPVLDHQVDCVISLFGFPVFGEFKRILRENGFLVTVDPGPLHLIELREKLYDIVKEKNSVPTENGFLTLQKESRHQHLIGAVDAALIPHMIAMTPHAYRVSQDKIQQTLLNPPSQLTLDLIVRVQD